MAQIKHPEFDPIDGMIEISGQLMQIIVEWATATPTNKLIVAAAVYLILFQLLSDFFYQPVNRPLNVAHSIDTTQDSNPRDASGREDDT